MQGLLPLAMEKRGIMFLWMICSSTCYHNFPISGICYPQSKRPFTRGHLPVTHHICLSNLSQKYPIYQLELWLSPTGFSQKYEALFLVTYPPEPKFYLSLLLPFNKLLRRNESINTMCHINVGLQFIMNTCCLWETLVSNNYFCICSVLMY